MALGHRPPRPVTLGIIALVALNALLASWQSHGSDAGNAQRARPSAAAVQPPSVDAHVTLTAGVPRVDHLRWGALARLVGGRAIPGTGTPGHPQPAPAADPVCRDALPGTGCDDADAATSMDACDGRGSCSGTPTSGLPPITTSWYRGPDPAAIIVSFGLPPTTALAHVGAAGAVPAIPNLGDELGPVLLGWLSGRTVARNDDQPEVLVVGSVLDHFTRKFGRAGQLHANGGTAAHNITCWGPGAKYLQAGAWDPDGGLGGSPNAAAGCLDYRAFRGPLSREMCLMAGCGCPAVFGDPVLLLPLFYRPRPQNTEGARWLPTATPAPPAPVLCIVPHVAEYEMFSAALSWLAALGVPSIAGQHPVKGEVRRTQGSFFSLPSTLMWPSLTRASVRTHRTTPLPHARRAPCHAQCPCWSDADWCLPSDGVANSRLQVRYFPPFNHVDGVLGSGSGTVVRFIDIRTADPAAFVDQLAGCPWVASSSLHGLILAEAYGVPWLRIKFYGPRAEADLKYRDFALSIGAAPGTAAAAVEVDEYSDLGLDELVQLSAEVRRAFVLRTTDAVRPGGLRQRPNVSLASLVAACPFCHPAVVARLQRAFEALTAVREPDRHGLPA